MLTIGLTGGIASGKSLAANTFDSLSVPVLEGDVAAREVVAPGTPALDRIRQTFGEAFFQADGQLDRRKLREHVFADAAARKTLERITHPFIRERLLKWRDTQTAPYCVLAIPILIESGMDALVDRILVVDAPVELQLKRLRERDGIGEPLARRMLDAQATREQRLTRAHDVLLNTGAAQDLRAAVERLHRFYLELAHTGDRHAAGLHLP